MLQYWQSWQLNHLVCAQSCCLYAEVTESPEGRGALECVVSVPNEFLPGIPQTKDYLQQLRAITPSVTSKYALYSDCAYACTPAPLQLPILRAFSSIAIAYATC